MSTQIRQSVFETNSSSTHNICVAKNRTLNLPSSLHFELGQFGWEEDTLRSVGELKSMVKEYYCG